MERMVKDITLVAGIISIAAYFLFSNGVRNFLEYLCSILNRLT